MKARAVGYLCVVVLLALPGCGDAEAAGGSEPPMDPGGGPPDLGAFGCNAAIKLMENGGLGCRSDPNNVGKPAEIEACQRAVCATAWPLLANGTPDGVRLTNDVLFCIGGVCPTALIRFIDKNGKSILLGFDPGNPCVVMNKLVANFGIDGVCSRQLAVCGGDGQISIWPLGVPIPDGGP